MWQRDAGITEFLVLSALSKAHEHALRMSDLAEFTVGTLSRLRPSRPLRVLVPLVVVVSFVPDFLLLDDGGAAGGTALLLMHVAVVTIAVPVYRRVMPLPAG
ncbi:hypothetical protein [Streptomyces sp. NPDC056987]|uniref:hypothetical protein n=1 Tax=Streptomyces sp. NPDC056987 TaxID=3345988 RepID=UPI003626412B